MIASNLANGMRAMPLLLYERLCIDDRRPSPYCWRARLALAHKGLAPEYCGVKFTEADKVGFSGQGKVPVLVDGEATVFDSWDIACYLEEAYPDAPSLFGGPGGRELARVLNHWTDKTLQAAFAPILAPSMLKVAYPDDRDYYRQTREPRYGCTLEALAARRGEFRANLDRTLEPLRLRLAESPYLSGEAPAYGDYLAFAEFQWARCADPEDLLSRDDKDRDLRAWRARMLEAHNGLAMQVPAFSSAA